MPRKKKEKVETPLVDEPKSLRSNSEGPNDPGDENDNGALRAKIITPVEGAGPFKKTTETFTAEEANKFQRMCIDISNALRTPTGTKLSCRLKILVENKEAVIYQGLIGNVWARVRANGSHNIYRHALKTLLTENEKTKEYFS